MSKIPVKVIIPIYKNELNRDELNELKSYVYATRMYYLKTLQIIEKEKRKFKEQENLNEE